MSGIYHNFKPGRAGASAANARYISRTTAVRDGERGLYEHNLPDYLRGETYAETRANLTEYARQRDEDERARPTRGGGEARTHYRAQLSFEGRVDAERAREMASEYMRENFPNARGFAVVHQDTEHTHAHIWLDARQTDGKKLNVSMSDYKRLDERWARIYGREFGQEKEREHLAKKQETRDWKRAQARGEQSGEKPQRASRSMTRGDYEQRERRNYGVDENRTRGDQRAVAAREQALAHGERAVERYAQQSERTAEAARGALQQAERLRDRERELDRGR